MFEREVYVWHDLRHPNVLPLLGLTCSENGYPMFISEWMSNGDAFAYIKSTNPPPETLLRLVSIFVPFKCVAFTVQLRLSMSGVGSSIFTAKMSFTPI